MTDLSFSYRLPLIPEGIAEDPPEALPSHPKSTLIGKRHGTITLPLAPLEVSHTGGAIRWTTVDRTGRKPLLLPGGQDLRVADFDLQIVAFQTRAGSGGGVVPTHVADNTASVEALINQLKAMSADANERITWSYGALERGTWVMTKCEPHSERRQPGSNAITQATVSITLQEASDGSVAVKSTAATSTAATSISGNKGTLITGVDVTKLRSVDIALNPPTAAASTSSAGTKYTVKSGDTLWALAVRYYGDGNLWRKIGDANSLRSATINVGQVLTIPPK